MNLRLIIIIGIPESQDSSYNPKSATASHRWILSGAELTATELSASSAS